MNEELIRAQVEQISPLTDSITRLILTPEDYRDYDAGQYLQIILGKEALSYSIANAPLGSHKYELHIRHSPDNPCNQRLFSSIKKQGYVNVRLPFGSCCLRSLDKQRPILFIAGGTGFAPVKAMIEQLLSNTDKRLFELFWGARGKSDLYWDDHVRHWQKHASHFHYFSALSMDNSAPLINQVLAQHAEDLQDWQIVLSGPFDMVYNLRDALVQQGISAQHLFSDAFSFENPKEKK